jgi:hypothetical protein
MPRINPGLLLSEEDLDPEKLQGRRIACRRNCTATGTVALQETAIAMFHGLVPIFTDYRVVLNCSRWQTIAGESRDSLEESPNTIRQHAA